MVLHCNGKQPEQSGVGASGKEALVNSEVLPEHYKNLLNNLTTQAVILYELCKRHIKQSRSSFLFCPRVFYRRLKSVVSQNHLLLLKLFIQLLVL